MDDMDTMDEMDESERQKRREGRAWLDAGGVLRPGEAGGLPLTPSLSPRRGGDGEDRSVPWLDESGVLRPAERAAAPVVHEEAWLDDEGVLRPADRTAGLPPNAYVGPGGEFVKGVAGMGTGIASFLLDLPAQAVGSDWRPGAEMQASVEEALPSDPEAGFWGRTLPQAAGSAATFLVPGGVVGKLASGAGKLGRAAGALTSAGIGGLAQGGQGVQEAQAAGAGRGATLAAAALNFGLGTTEALPWMKPLGAGVRGLEALAPDVVADGGAFAGEVWGFEGGWCGGARGRVAD